MEIEGGGVKALKKSDFMPARPQQARDLERFRFAALGMEAPERDAQPAAGIDAALGSTFYTAGKSNLPHQAEEEELVKQTADSKVTLDREHERYLPGSPETLSCQSDWVESSEDDDLSSVSCESNCCDQTNDVTSQADFTVTVEARTTQASRDLLQAARNSATRMTLRKLIRKYPEDSTTLAIKHELKLVLEATESKGRSCDEMERLTADVFERACRGGVPGAPELFDNTFKEIECMSSLLQEQF